MKFSLIYIFIIFSFFVSAQKKKPFIENITDINTKTDTLPFFVYQKEELDTFITLNKTMPVNAEMYGVKCEDRIVFKVDKNNKINSMSHVFTDILIPQTITMKDYSYYDTLKLYFQKESERVIRLTEGLWFSDSLRAGREIRIKINYVSAAFKDLNRGGSDIHVQKNVSLGTPNSLLAKKELYDYGVRKFQAKKTVLAKVYFEEAVKYYPKDIDAHYNLASCYYKLKNIDKACQQWQKCIELGDKTVQQEIIKYCK
jgi:tetratricopeptide (TPR) repeat protein